MAQTDAAALEQLEPTQLPALARRMALSHGRGTLPSSGDKYEA
jgi:hypothetical protein